ncbi:DUF503 domain-containing protein [Nitriliruptoraceae bacterium ZYF776]|nr:DUF503 domain-containing protein [Profundirhabdus halotolerans]
MHHGAARIDLHLPGVDSLKAKRSVLRRTEARLRDELGVAVAEIGFQDRWRRAALGVATVSGSATGVDRVLDRVAAVVERDPRVEVVAVEDLVDVLDADPPDLPPGS